MAWGAVMTNKMDAWVDGNEMGALPSIDGTKGRKKTARTLHALRVKRPATLHYELSHRRETRCQDDAETSEQSGHHRLWTTIGDDWDRSFGDGLGPERVTGTTWNLGPKI